MQRIKLFVIALFLLALASFKFLPSSVAVGQSNLFAPTGVIASDNSYQNKVGLTWDAIRGATAYRVFRNTTNDSTNAVSVGTTAADSFFDTTATAGQTYFYWVRAENGGLLSELSQPDTGVRAVGNGNNGLQPPPAAPSANPVTAAKAYLGKTLFWDEQLSSTKTVACGTCHQAGNGGSDPRSIFNNARADNPGFDNALGTADDVFGSPGVIANNADGTYNWSTVFGLKEQVTGRKSPSYINAAYSNVLFWDGRALSAFTDPISNSVVIPNGAALESQVLGPPVSSGEMGHGGRNWNDVASRITVSKPLALSATVPAALTDWISNRTYAQLFEEAFGTPDVTPSRIAMAIATFERTLYTDRTPWDAAQSGITPLTAQEQRGQGVFNQAQCNVCHAGTLFSDNQFHYIGLRPTNEDTGRFQVTNNTNNLGQFRTPSLRNVELRAPFMHNGRFATLEDVVAFYNRGGDFNAPNKDPQIRPRGLSAQQQSDLVAFLKRPLTDPRVATQTAPFNRPTLYTESNRVPQIIGTGTSGTGAFVPQVVAIEPPLLGNPSFTIGLTSALGGSSAVLVIDSNDPGTSSIPLTASFARINTTLAGSGAGNGYGSINLQIPNNPALAGATFYGRWFVNDTAAPNGIAVSKAFKFTVFGDAPTIVRAKHADFDGDGKTDISIFRPSDGTWYIKQSSNSNANAQTFGLGSDKLVPADYDGDGKTDVAVFRNGTWYLQSSTAGFTTVQFGLADDIPQSGDFDGDGKDDIAIFRPSTGTWFTSQNPAINFGAVQFGQAGDLPVPADYDGDGKTDIAVYRGGAWYIRQSGAGFKAVQFGTAEDKPVIGDYDGDGKSDVAVFRPSNATWYYLRSSDGTVGAKQFGSSTDTPSPGDYDGDGKADFAVFRPTEGNWYILQNANNALRTERWGTSGDVSVPAAIVP